MKLIAGVDEVGRGPLAGPVVACAVILDDAHPISGLADSKLLTSKRREALCAIIKKRCIAWAIGSATVEEIDRFNILQASLIAMRRAVYSLMIEPDHVQIDGTYLPRIKYSAEAIIDGDDLIPVISAASIIAKVTRDRQMEEYDKQYPGYGFAGHKGYGTKEHLEALEKFGATPIHRRSFSPVSKVLL
jgi:ribonuclease HII